MTAPPRYLLAFLDGTLPAKEHGMTDSERILRSIKAHLDVMDSVLQDMRAILSRECPICHNSRWMPLDASLVPCACLDHGLDEQTASRGQ
jgi:hypothetical protein